MPTQWAAQHNNPQELLVSYLLTDSRSLAFQLKHFSGTLVTSHGNGHSYIDHSTSVVCVPLW